MNDHCTTVLLDLDGVIRHFDPTHRPGVEKKYGLAEGTLWAAGFETDLIERVTTGKISRQQWIAATGESIGAPAAAEEWLGARGSVDQELLVIVDELRSNGMTVAVLTNGTDTVRAELNDFGITDRFDAIFNSAEIGHTKPDPRAFEAVCDQLDVDPASVFFTDDSERKLAGAIELGMAARLYEGVPMFRQHLAEHAPEGALG